MDSSEHKNTEYWKAEVVSFCALQSLKGVGFKTLYSIASQKVSFRDVLKSEPAHFQKILRIKLDDSLTKEQSVWDQYQRTLWATGLESARKLVHEDIKIVFYHQDAFPAQLRNIDEPPMWLFIQGNLRNLNIPSVAIVGSREASDDGLWLTKYVVASLDGADISTVSGLAHGIDQKAHVESMVFNIPTVAILGTGIDSNYPKGSESVRAEILKNNGTIVSEYLLGQSYSAENFIRRNRIQAGLSNAVIPVEWKVKSGTAHTVNFAKSYARKLLMPYLPNTDSNSPEIQIINSYQHGKAILIPQHGNELLEILLSLKFEDITSGNIEGKTQLPLDM